MIAAMQLMGCAFLVTFALTYVALVIEILRFMKG